MHLELLSRWFAFTLLLVALPASAEIYQWKDENGKTVFSERAPQGAKSTVVKPKTSPPSTAAIEKLKAQTAPPKQPAEDPAKNAADKAAEPTPEEKKANCAKSRATLTKLHDNPRLRYKQENGELAYLPEEDRQQRIKETEANIAKWCGK
jgi:Domain of unknown function (DUF4124)